MEYRYGKDMNYEDFSSGRVLYQVRGMTNFPVRLAQEIYGRCLEYSTKKEDIVLYDCCCGGGYLLTVLGFLNQDTINRIIGSDIDEEMVQMARKNLSLLRQEGINKRIREIHEMIEEFNKPSHYEAKESALRLREMLKKDMDFKVFQADALGPIDLDEKPDIIITDLPYGQLVSWSQDGGDMVDRLLDSLYEVAGEDTILGLCMDKKQKVKNEKFTRLERQKIGKRRFEILKKI